MNLLRLVAGYGAIACAVPYLGLKVIWLSGGRLGVADPAMMGDPSMIALNVVSGAMDLVAILIALAFTHAWGMRIPAWLVLPPAWVGLGLLVRFVAAVPVNALGKTLTARSPAPVSGPVEPWVYTLVYTEFVGMGIGLTLGFLLYARARWYPVFQPSTHAASAGLTHRVQVPLANTAALMAAAVGGVHLAWASGAAIGIPDDLAARRTFSSYIVNAVDGTTMMAAALGVLMLVHRAGRQSAFWIHLALAWVGSGFLFAWGLWGLINVLGNTALVRAVRSPPPLLNLLLLVQLVSGLVIGLIILFLLAERTAAYRSHQLEQRD